MLEDDLVQPQPDFDKINDEDYRAWLGEALDSTGCPEWASRQSPLVIALYDLAFSRPTTLAAGVTLNVVLRLGLDYRGHLAWKMNAGMGDVVFAPLFIALQARKNVTFNFFHRVIKLGLDAAKQRVETIELEQQVALAAPYDPLIDVGGLACWPNEPKAALLPASYQADRASQQKMPYDFEHDPPGSNKYTAGPLMLTRGSEFDVVVLAISIGAFDDVANDLKLPGSKFAAMVDGLKTMRTQALQVWLGVNFQQLGSPAPAGMVISYYEPFNSWSDMSQVLNKEQWGFVPVHNISYFCDALPDDLVSDAAAAAFVAQNATQFLQHDVTPLWPGFVGVNEISRLPRANVDKSDRYVLSEAGSIGKRLAPYDSGFINLALAGDWVHTTLNAGCLEAATLGGLGAADAILSGKVTP
jgi:uncharacterized protein with NAD-binding domain and iron-sulfur cluster